MTRPPRIKSGAVRSERRREDLRRKVPRPTRDLLFFLTRPEVASALALTAAFIIITGLLVVWSREQVSPPIGQIMTETKFNRISFAVMDHTLTTQAREEARRNAPRVYRLNTANLDRISASLRGLPRALSGKSNLADIAEEIVQEFRLTEQGLQSIANYATDAGVDPRWNRWVDALIGELEQAPILGSIRFDERLMTADLEGRPVDEVGGKLFDEVKAIRSELLRHLKKG